MELSGHLADRGVGDQYLMLAYGIDIKAIINQLEPMIEKCKLQSGFVRGACIPNKRVQSLTDAKELIDVQFCFMTESDQRRMIDAIAQYVQAKAR